MSDDPAAELAGYRDQRMAGSMDQATYLAHAERLGPLIEGAALPEATPSEQAQTQIAQLQRQLLHGKINERDFLAQMDRLGPLAYPEDPSVTTTGPDGSTITMGADEAALIDQALAPPSSPGHYQFDYGLAAPNTAEELQFDTQIREAFHAAAIPAMYARPIYSSVNELAKRFANASADEINTHVNTVASELRSKWGADYAKRIDAIDEMVTQIKGPLGDRLAEAPWVFANVMTMLQLDEIARHRARKRA